MKKKMGLLVMAYGTPRSLDEVEAYYTHIRRGRKPTKEQLDDLIDRYKAIGGVSPLAKITDEQTKRLEEELNRRSEDMEFRAYLGLRHIDPFIEDAVRQMKEDGIEETVSLVLAPHYSTYSIKMYNERALEESEKINGPIIKTIDSWYDEPKFIEYWAKKIEKTIANMPDHEKDHHVVIFSAHSLPERMLINDPYPDQLKETAKLIAEKANIKNYAVGWQSEGNTPEPWIGPDVQDLTRDLYDEGKYEAFVYCPVGFVADHLEVLYDNDYECKVVTDELGVSYYRPEMPNAKKEFIEMLATVVEKRIKEEE